MEEGENGLALCGEIYKLGAGAERVKWGQDFDRSYEENKKKFWKEVRKGGLRMDETIKDVNGRLLKGNEARKRWAEYFDELLNVQEDRKADIVAVGGVQVPVMGEEKWNFYIKIDFKIQTCLFT